MSNLKAIELKAFVPAKDFDLSKHFYQDLGFVKASDGDGNTVQQTVIRAYAIG